MKYFNINTKTPDTPGEYLCRIVYDMTAPIDENKYPYSANGEIYRVKRWANCRFETAQGYTVTHWMDAPKVVIEPDIYISSLYSIYLCGSYKLAGKMLHLSNNTVKYRIQKLELKLNQELVKSTGGRAGGTTLTKAGIKVLAQWQAVNST